MAAKTSYICQPYVVDKKKGLQAGMAIHCHNEGTAHRRAHRLLDARLAVGVDVVMLTADPDMGDYGEPEFLARLGQVPAHVD